MNANMQAALTAAGVTGYETSRYYANTLNTYQRVYLAYDSNDILLAILLPTYTVDTNTISIHFEVGDGAVDIYHPINGNYIPVDGTTITLNQGVLKGFSGSYNDLSNKPSLATVATSGDYDDLTNKPDLSIYAESANLGDCAYLDESNLSIDYSQITNTPTNYVTTNTDQTISGVKTLTNHLVAPSLTSFVQDSNSTRSLFLNSDGFYPYYVGGLDLGKNSSGCYWNNFYMNGKINPNSSGYGLVLPDTSSYAASKTIATTSDLPTNTNQLVNGAGFLTDSDLEVVTVSSTAVSGATTAASITIGSDSYNFPSGGSNITIDTTTGSEYISDGTNTLEIMTRNTSQDISGSKTFTSYVTAMGNNFRIRAGSGTTATSRPTVSFRNAGDQEVGFLQFHLTNNQMVFGCDERYSSGIQVGLRQYASSGAYSVLLPTCANKTTGVGSGDINFPLGLKLTEDTYGQTLPTPVIVKADANGVIDVTNLLHTYFGRI